MHNPILPFLSRQKIMILDGGLATELERRGAELSHSLWSAKLLMEAPQLIEQVHYDYFSAGADVATSASYQATLAGFSAVGIEVSKATDLLRLSVMLAKQARDRFWEQEAHRDGRLKPLVAASAGSYGAFLADGSEFTGDFSLSVQELIDFHAPRLEILASAKPDLIAFETIPRVREAEAVVRLLEDFPELTAWVSFSCRNNRQVSHGELFEECAALAAESDQVVAVGINCTAPDFVPGLLHSAVPTVLKPLMAYPNSGELWNANTKSWYAKESQMSFSQGSLSWYEAGARLIGGCCRTTPENISEISNIFRQ